MKFEWDPIKAEKNIKKHEVSFEEAVSVFYDSQAATFVDTDHSKGEWRYITIGFTSRNRLLVISHSEVGEDVRIISARIATARERKKYEENEKKTFR